MAPSIESTSPAVLDAAVQNNSQDGDGLNSTEEPIWYPSRDETLAKIEILISASLCFLAVMGNSTVIACLWRRRKNLSRMHCFIIHLCVADLTVAFLYTMPQMLWDITYKFYAPNAICKIVKFMQLFPVYLSSYILVMTAIDRYMAICHPLMGLRGNHTRRMRLMVLTAWAISVVCSLPQMWFFEVQNRTPKAPTPWNDCRHNFASIVVTRAYVTFFTMAVYIIPTLILTLMYGLICRTVWKNMDNLKYKSPDVKHTSQKDNNNWEEDETDKLHPEHVELQQTNATKRDNQSSQKPQMLYRRHGAAGKVSRAKMKTVKMTLTIVTMYVTTWAPFFISQMLSVWANVIFDSIPFTVMLLLTSVTSCVNPWIYFLFSSNAVRDIQQAFGCLHVFRGGHSLASDRTHHDENSSRYVSTTASAAASM